LLFASGALLSG